MLTYQFSPSLIDHIRSMLLQFAPWKSSHSEKLKQAAVGIILVAADDGSNETSFLLTLRYAKMRSHAGQYALPGGRIDQGENAVDTVIRECMEEIGLKLSADQVLGILDLYATQSGYAITPVVFAATREPNFFLNPNEVEQVFRIKLSDLSGERSAQFFSQEEGGPLLIRFPIFDHHIHAPTAAILYQFVEVVAGRYQQVDNLAAPDFATR
ncbi:NUDIX hydrolase [Allomesorhizobium camelthorni]|uniref:CoA pyrophosphatase n=1 Tax=Allomesorhizobium camelthorni TaxID=475069 RepID=A0A6G4WJ73_9HYPH|nr:CoA pyrophosphatase [Mesorhizobium camelthorni]NGO54664.1 CoA pyrophosphatase [Mesorhizobium camelthorni]